MKIRLSLILGLIFYLSLNILAQPGSPYAPASGHISTNPEVSFSWNSYPLADTYDLQIAQDANFTIGVQNYDTTATKYIITLPTQTKYYWRVRAVISGIPQSWSKTSTYTYFGNQYIATLGLWLNADTLVTLNGATVSQWGDLSGNNRHAVQTTTANQPTYIASDTGINNHKSINFDGVNDSLSGSAITNLGNSSITMFIMLQGNNQPSGDAFPGIFTIGPLTTGMCLTRRTGAFEYIMNWTNNSFYASNNGTFPNAGFNYGIFLYHKNFSVISEMYLNNNLLKNTTSGTLCGAFTNNVYNLGKTIGYKYLSGRISEILVYTSSLNSQDKANVNKYISHHYIPPVNLGADINIPYGFETIDLDAGSRFLSYSWSTGETNQNISITTSGAYYVTVFDKFGTTSMDTIWATYPSTSLNTNDVTLCLGDSIKIKVPAISGKSGYSYLWSTGETDSTIYVSTEDTIYVRISDSLANQKWSDTIIISIDSFAFFVGLGNDTSICSGNDITLYSSPYNADIVSFLWSDSETDTSITIYTTDDYWVEVQNISGCYKKDTIHVTISGIAPSTGFTVTPSCLNDTTYFTDTSSIIPPDSIVCWYWDFDDGDTSVLKNPAHLYSSAGKYLVSHTSVTSGGCYSTYSDTVTVYELPNANFTSTTTCIGYNSYFFDNSSAGVGDSIISWIWDFDDSDSAFVQNPTHNYTSAATYDVNLTIYTLMGCSNNTTNQHQVLLTDLSPQTFTLISPTNGIVTDVFSNTFSWNPSVNATLYKLQISDNPSFTGTLINIITTNTSETTSVGSYGIWYWRVIAYNYCYDSTISQSRTFTVFSPGILGGGSLKLWLRADSVTLNGSNVNQWFDISGNNNHATQATTSLQPLHLASESFINNKPAIDFDGTDDLLSGGIIPGLGNKSITMFVILAGDAQNPASSFYGIFTIDSLDGFSLMRRTSTKQNLIHYNNGGYLETPFYSFADAGFNYTMVTLRKKFQNKTEFFINNILWQSSTSASLTGSFNNVNGYNIGKARGYSNFSGKIAEVILFDDSLNATNRNLVTQYLVNRYAPSVCLGPDIDITYGFCDTTISANTGFLHYIWSTGDTTQSITVNSNGTYSITATNIFGMLSSDTVIVSFPSVTLQDDSICYGSLAHLETGLDTAGYDFIWKDASITPDIYTSDPGLNWVTIFDTNGCQIIKYATIYVDSFPYTASLGPDKNLCRGDILGLVSGSQDAVSYLWSTGSGNSLIQINDSLGSIKDYSVTVYSSFGCIATDTITIKITGELPNVSFLSDSVCLGLTTNFTNLSTAVLPSVITIWDWDFGDGDSSNQENPTHNYQNYGPFTVTLTATTDSGCSNTFNKTVKVWAIPTADFDPINGCTDVTVQFSDQSVNNYGTNTIWYWDLGNTMTSSSQNPQNIYDSAGDYNCTLIVNTTPGCADTITKIIHIKQSLDLEFDYTTACYGEPVYFADVTNTDPWNPVIQWLWKFGDGDSAYISNPSHLYDSAGNYTVTLTTKALNGCINTLSTALTVYSNPVADIIEEFLCAGTLYQFSDASTVSNDSITSWYWDIDGYGTSTLQSPSVILTDTGEISVSLGIATTKGCSDTIEKEFRVYPQPIVSFDFTPEFGNPPLNVSFNNTSTGSTTWLWDFGNGDTSTIENPDYTYAIEDTFTVQLTAYNQYGCEDKASDNIYVMILNADIAVIKAYAEINNNDLLIISADLLNTGTLKITALDLYARYNGSHSIVEHWAGLLLPGETMHYDFTASFEIPDYITIDFACVEAQITGYVPDYQPNNNEACVVLQNEFNISGISPNPGQNYITLNLIIPYEDNLEIVLFNSIGKKISQLHSGKVSEGYFRIVFDASVLNSDVYYIRAIYRDKIKIQEFIKY